MAARSPSQDEMEFEQGDAGVSAAPALRPGGELATGRRGGEQERRHGGSPVPRPAGDTDGPGQQAGGGGSASKRQRRSPPPDGQGGRQPLRQSSPGCPEPGRQCQASPSRRRSPPPPGGRQPPSPRSRPDRAHHAAARRAAPAHRGSGGDGRPNWHDGRGRSRPDRLDGPLQEPRGREGPPFRRGGGGDAGGWGRGPPEQQQRGYDAPLAGGGGRRSDSPDYNDAGPRSRRAVSPGHLDAAGPRSRLRRSPSPPPPDARWGGGGRRQAQSPYFMPRSMQQHPCGEGGSGGGGRGHAFDRRDGGGGGRGRGGEFDRPPPRSRSRERVPPPRRCGSRSPPPQRQRPMQRQEAREGPPAARVAIGMVAGSADAAADIVRRMMGGSGAKPELASAAPPPGSGLSLEQKKKLLWGGKKEAAAVVVAAEEAGRGVEAAPQAVFGHNRWDQAEFTSEQDRMKFIKMMGGKTAAETLLYAPNLPSDGPAEPAEPVYGPAAPWEAQAQAAGVAAGPEMGPALPLAAVAAAAAAGAPEGPGIMKRERQQQVLGELEREFHSGIRRMANRTVGLGM